MLKNEKGITLAMLTLTVAILLLIAFATILLVFDSGIFPADNITIQNNNNEPINNQTLQSTEFNRTEAINRVN